ncbi:MULTISPECIES: SMP-30/gluconolactonase/LRE family protein [unclassified Spirosoma]|uniref:SMP-30/gluconolactonase/LRE family protein n=1 Tax=unclassified Spirosoma TaxID=2621999 RepID=UPI0009645CF2|nr:MULTISPECIES: SMP-30/gluconolactonase/LRE family protein [unclassified Spirosoma]MBN8823594.1 SMP-30/gluconolactonase/LRE family protein [Spirosoma sp.]OJW76846.1 MAG: gluconolaconase [Spirosoma sp. 48-14]
MITRTYSIPTLLLVGLSLAACNSTDPEFNAPVIPQRIDFVATRQYPEGITYSPTIDKFLVSSITQGKIGTVDQNGRYEELIANDKQLISSIGMKVRDGLLYVCNGDQGVSDKSTPQTALKTAGLFVYDLATKQKVRQIDLASLLPTSNHFANDIAFDNDGNAYVTDSFAPVIYKISANSEQAVVAVTSTLFSGDQGINLNGIVYHPDKYLLVVKSNEGKLFKVELDDNTITEVTGVSLPNGDGMLLYNNDLYVVNSRNKVSQVRSTDGWKTATLVKTDEAGYDQATTNVLVGDKIYSLNARIDEVSAAAAAKDPSRLQANTYSIQQFK